MRVSSWQILSGSVNHQFVNSDIKLTSISVSTYIWSIFLKMIWVKKVEYNILRFFKDKIKMTAWRKHTYHSYNARLKVLYKPLHYHFVISGREQCISLPIPVSVQYIFSAKDERKIPILQNSLYLCQFWWWKKYPLNMSQCWVTLLLTFQKRGLKRHIPTSHSFMV